MKLFQFLKHNKWVVLILGLATFLRFYHLNFQSLWMDEIYTMNVSNPSQTWFETYQHILKREGFPYFYFFSLRFFYFIFGYTATTARLVSVLGGIGCVYAIYLIGKELNNYKVGLFAALLVAVNEYQIYISQDARPYSLYFLATVLSFYRLIIFIKKANLKNAIWYGIFTGLLLNINFFGLINVFTQAIILLIFIFLSPKTDRFDFFKKAVISGTIALLLFAPNYLMLQKLINVKSFWVYAPKSNSFSLIFSKFFGESEILTFILLPLFIFYFIKLFQNLEDKKWNYDNIINNKTLFSFLILFIWFFVFFSILMIKSYGKISYLLARYFISITPVLFLVLGISIYSIKGKMARKIVLSTLIFYTLVNLFVVKKYYTTCLQTQFRELSSYVIKHNSANDKVFSEYKYWYDYYFNSFHSKTKIENSILEKVVLQMRKDSTNTKSFWYIGISKKPYNPKPNTKDFLDKNFTINETFEGYQVWAKHFEANKNSQSK